MLCEGVDCIAGMPATPCIISYGGRHRPITCSGLKYLIWRTASPDSLLFATHPPLRCGARSPASGKHSCFVTMSATTCLYGCIRICTRHIFRKGEQRKVPLSISRASVCCNMIWSSAVSECPVQRTYAPASACIVLHPLPRRGAKFHQFGMQYCVVAMPATTYLCNGAHYFSASGSNIV